MKTMKKGIAALLSTAMIFTMLPQTVFANEETQEPEYTTQVEDTEEEFPALPDNSVVEFEIIDVPGKTEYFEYEVSQINLNGMSYRIAFQDGTVVEDSVMSETDYDKILVQYENEEYYIVPHWQNCDEFGMAAVGENVLVFNVGGQEYIVDAISILENPVQSIELVSNPRKTMYLYYEQEPDMYGAKIRITYADETVQDIQVTEHGDKVTVDEQKNELCASFSRDTKGKKLWLNYMNIDVEVLELPYQIDNLTTESLADEMQVKAVLSKEQPYQVYSYTPKETGIYYFYSGGNQDTYIELYQGNTLIYTSSDRNSWADYETGETSAPISDVDVNETGYMNGYAGKELIAGTTYYYAIALESSLSIDRTYEIWCCFSSAISSLSSQSLSGMEVIKVPKNIWYEFESDQMYYSEGEEWGLHGTQIELIYWNGWRERFDYSDSMNSSDEIYGRELTVQWLYTTTVGDMVYIDSREDNALMYSLGTCVTEVPVYVNVESPVKYIEILSNPVPEQEIYPYQKDNVEEYLDGLVVAVHYKDGRLYDLLRWYGDDESGCISIPELNGYSPTVSIQEVCDADKKPTGDYDLCVQYMGVSASVPVSLLDTPVADIQIIETPEKMDHYSYEDIDDSTASLLHGLQVKILFTDGTSQMIKIDSDTDRIVVENNYHEELKGYIQWIDDSTGYLMIDYMGCTKPVGIYKEKSITDMVGVDNIRLGDNKQITLDSTNKYQIYQFVPQEDGTYQFVDDSEEGVDNYISLYSASGRMLCTCNGYSDIGSKFELTYTMIQGKTYYLVMGMRPIGASGAFTCTVNKSADSEEEQRQTIESIHLSLPNPVAGEELPFLYDCETETGYEILDYTWYGDSEDEDEDYADFATAYRLKLVLIPYSGYQFVSGTQVTVNGKKTVDKSVGANGQLTLYYTFPYTECKVGVPSLEGYDTDLSQNTNSESVNYGGNYKFRFIKNENNTSDEKLIVKANNAVLTSDDDGYYNLENVRENITVYVKTAQIEADAATDSKLTLHNQSEEIYDVLIGKRNSALTDNEAGENVLPILESYADDSDRFFYGWYQDKDEVLNGKGNRFTDRSVLKNSEYDLYAKWESGLFTTILNDKEAYYKVLSIDEDNKLRVQLGDGSNAATKSLSLLNLSMALSTGKNSTFVIPKSISTSDTTLKDSGIGMGECEVVAIAPNAFVGDNEITSIQLPDTIESIGANAFGGCIHLQEIAIPDSVTSIGTGAFEGCVHLESVEIPASVTEIAAGTFNGCSNLTSVTIAAGVSSIGADAFRGCTKLTTVILPDTMETIDTTAFAEESQKLTLVCSSALADSEVVKRVVQENGVNIQTVDIALDYDPDEKEFVYGDSAQNFKATVTVDGQQTAEREIIWNYPETDAYQFTVDGNSITVLPKRVTTEGENIVLTATDTASGKIRSIVLRTVAINLEASDSDGDSEYVLEIQNADKQVYTGTVICPKVIVKKNFSGEIVAADNYDVTYRNNTEAGTAGITVVGKSNYFGELEGSFVIGKKAQTIIANGVTKTVGDPVFSIGAKTDGGGALTYDSSDKNVVTVTQSGDVAIVGIGTATVTINAAETSNYKSATKTITIAVNKKLQTITANNVAKAFGDAPFGLGAKSNGNGTLSYSSDNLKVAKVDTSTGMVTIVGAGTAKITINASATAQYAAATKTITLTVSQGDAKLKVKTTSYTKALGSKAFTLGATAKSGLKYKSSNSKIATVSSSGKVTLKSSGKVTITISTNDKNYKAATKKVTIKVLPKKAKIKSVSSKKAGQLIVSWNRQKEAAGYVVQYSTDKKFKKNVKTVTIKKNSTTSTTIKNLSKGKKYYVRVKAYTTIDKKKAYGAASNAVSKTTKKK